jgi:tetratricopeptide (TPR) repeat protein
MRWAAACAAALAVMAVSRAGGQAAGLAAAAAGGGEPAQQLEHKQNARLAELEQRVRRLEKAAAALEKRCAASPTTASPTTASRGASGNPEELLQQAWREMQRGNREDALGLFKRVLELAPKSVPALIHVGLDLIANSDPMRGADMLERTFAEDAVPGPMTAGTEQGVALLQVVGRLHDQYGDPVKAEGLFSQAASSPAGNDCARIQYGTLLMSYPRSKKAADENIQKFHWVLDSLLAKPGALSLGNTGVAGMDPYGFCFLSAFAHSFYYDSDARASLGKYMRVAAKAFPELRYTAPHLAAHGAGLPRARPRSGAGSKVRLGLLSAFFSHKSSVMLDFSGVMDRLPRDRFEVFVIRAEGELAQSRETGGAHLYAGRPGDTVVDVKVVVEADWLDNLRAKIAALDLDLLLYLDSTMSGALTKLSWSKLARVHAVTHGHPMTTGVDKSVMNYFVSWAAAELPSAAEHYTEQLELLPADSIHQWYEPRVPNGVSDIDGMPFRALTRDSFAMFAPANGNWYICMQKPFKRAPEFDPMLAAVLKQDPAARLLLHAADTPETQAVLSARLRDAGADMARVHWLPQQPHHRLMAIYALCDVVLDSYPASGCTTTREALEVGGLVVTLPAKYLGSRWTLAYYNIIGVGVEELVATNRSDYVVKAVRVATDRAFRAKLQARILASVHKLWYRQSAVDNWAALLERIATKPPPA